MLRPNLPCRLVPFQGGPGLKACRMAGPPPLPYVLPNLTSTVHTTRITPSTYGREPSGRITGPGSRIQRPSRSCPFLSHTPQVFATLASNIPSHPIPLLPLATVFCSGLSFITPSLAPQLFLSSATASLSLRYKSKSASLIATAPDDPANKLYRTGSDTIP